MDSILVNTRLKGLQVGSSAWFNEQRKMIKEKPLIKRCYDLWYKHLLDDIAKVSKEYQDAAIVELGSGAGYLKELEPKVITSDVVEGVADQVIDGRKMPFEDHSVKGIFLTHVFHHIPQVEAFLQEANRVLVPGGVISIIDCSHTPFARFFFSTFHPEPYDDKAVSWDFAQTDAMLDSNQALTWIVLERDLERFNREYPMFKVEKKCLLPWFSYLMSGGVNLRSLVPPFLAKLFVAADYLLTPFDPLCAIHWHITLRKNVNNVL
jgi:SAM-dependent methyltransferase